MVKIIFNIIGVDPPFNKEHGGAMGKLISYQIDFLQKQGHEVIAFVDKESYFKKEGIRVILYNGKTSCDNILVFILYGFFQFICLRNINADIVISTHPRNIVSSFLYSRYKRKKWIAWELDHVFWVKPITCTKKIFYMFIKFAKMVFTISSQQKRWILERGCCSDRIELVYDCIDTDWFIPSRQAKRDNYILYVAKFSERKNHLFLIKAFEKVIDSIGSSDLRLLLIGSKTGVFTQRERFGKSSSFLKCERYVSEKGLSQRVDFLDDIKEEELIRFYQKAKLFVMPSVEEGFGLTLLEAMACGCTCIANNIEPLSEVLGASGILFEAADSSQLADKIYNVLVDSREREKLGVIARERAVSIFDKKKIGEIFERLICEI
ncbi:MAG: glycosyltransferase family 4 protein [Candidatus Omnitrophica bacterium]|nr:glycosyltransferase family 4 protein [Candidatus Omnitrophota bacterium]